MEENIGHPSGARRVSRRGVLQGASALAAATAAAWLVGVEERPATGQVSRPDVNPSGGTVNVTYLHTGVLSEEVAALSGSWSWWDDYDRATLNAYNQVFQDASCTGAGYFFIAMNWPTGSLWRIKDSDLSVTHLVLAGRGSGADMCYDARRGCVWVLWGNENLGTNGMSRIDVATWTESAYTAAIAPLTSYGGRPSLALSADGDYLYVAAFDSPNIQRLAIGPGPAFALANDRIIAFPSDIDTYAYFHIVRVDPADGNVYATTAYSSYAVRLDTDGNVVWERAEVPAMRDGVYVTSSVQHDDMAFDSTCFYVPASSGPPGLHQYLKSNGDYVRTILDPYWTSGVDIDPATGDVYGPSYGLMGVIKTNVANAKVKGYRQADAQLSYVDDLDWNGSALWTIQANSLPGLNHAYFDVIRWNKIDGPAGAGRVRCSPSAVTPQWLRGGAQGVGNAGVYTGGQFWIEGLGFASVHWTCITLSSDATTTSWFAKVVVNRGGTIALLLNNGQAAYGSAAVSGWNSIELRYDESARRYRVYLGPGQPCIDFTAMPSGAASVRSVIYGPWDADQTELLAWGIHTAFDIGLDVLMSDYEGARFGPVTAVRSTVSDEIFGDREWSVTGEHNAGGAISEAPDLLTGASREIAASFLSASGPADLWETMTNLTFPTPILKTMRHVRWGLRAFSPGAAGSIKLGYGGDFAVTKADEWALSDTLVLAESGAWYEVRAATSPGGGALPLDRHNVAIVYEAGSGDARVTQAALSHLWQLGAVEWHGAGVGGVAELPDVAALPAAAPGGEHSIAYPLVSAALALAAAIGAGSGYIRRKRR